MKKHKNKLTNGGPYFLRFDGGKKHRFSNLKDRDSALLFSADVLKSMGLATQIIGKKRLPNGNLSIILRKVQLPK